MFVSIFLDSHRFLRKIGLFTALLFHQSLVGHSEQLANTIANQENNAEEITLLLSRLNLDFEGLEKVKLHAENSEKAAFELLRYYQPKEYQCYILIDRASKNKCFQQLRYRKRFWVCR